jgi:hypothetical protein
MRSFLICLFLATLSYASIGKITVTNGDISVLRASKSLKASSGFALEEKDSIKSTKGSTAQLVFNDNTVITVGSNTTFSVQEYSSDASSPKAKFAIAEGTFKTITGKIGKIAPDKFKMETKTATIGIRGTTVVGNVAPDGTLTVACTRGAITVTPNVPQGQPTVVPQGQFTKSKGGNVEPPRQLTPNDLRNLQGDLAPLARNNTPATEAQEGGNGGGQPTQSTQNNPIPNLDNIKELTSKVAENLVNDKLTTSLSTPWAAAYGDDYDKDYAYWLDGRRSIFYASKANYDAQGGGFNYYNDSSSWYGSIYPTYNEASLDSFFSGITAYGAATVAGEDSFSFRLGGNIDGYAVNATNSKFYTMSDSAGADYASWGYWIAEYDISGTPYVKFGAWVGGALTLESEVNALVSSNAVASYKGQSIGGVVNSDGYYSAIAMNTNNAVNLTIGFGSNKSINGSINFDTVGGQQWRANITAGSGATQLAAAGAYFRTNSDLMGSFVGTGSNGSAINTGGIDGKFYGPNAKTIGGSFVLITDGNAKASGVFKANKQ